MAFRQSERHADELQTHGYTVFRGIVPPSLIDDLREACTEGRDRVRALRGVQVQRFQPISAFDLSPQPFQDFRELPELGEAIRRALTREHTYGDPSQMGVLLEPGESAWCTHWHRDSRDNQPHMSLASWKAAFSDWRCFGQSNCPLYADSSLWVVPGSHVRPDLPRETLRCPSRPVERPDLEAASPAARERRCREYAESMPGALQVHLAAGDYCLYRSVMWHMGSYLPYTRRATLHDFVDTPTFAAWRAATAGEARGLREQGVPAWSWWDGVG